MKIRYLLPIAFILLGAFIVIQADDVSADPIGNAYTIKDNVVLTQDVVYKDGSIITIMPGTTIDLVTYTMNFGSGSHVIVSGTTDITSDGGKLVVGDETSILLRDFLIPSNNKVKEYSFYGTLHFLMDKANVTMTYTPANDDSNVYITQENSIRAISNPRANYALGSQNILGYGFDGSEENEYSYDGDELLSIRNIVMECDDSMYQLNVTYLAKTTEISINGIISITDATHYEETDTTNTTRIHNLGTTTLSIGEDKMVHVHSSAGSLTLVETVKDKTTSNQTYSAIVLDSDLDLQVILTLFTSYGKDEASGIDILRSLKLSAETAVIWSESFDYLFFTEVYLEIDATEEKGYWLLITARQGTTLYTVKASEVVISAFTLSRQLLLDLDASFAEIIAEKNADGDSATLYLTDTDLQVNHLNLAVLYYEYTKKGTIEIQEILDNCVIMHLDIAESLLDSDGDGTSDIAIEGLDFILQKDAKGLNTMNLEFTSFETVLEKDESSTQIHLDDTSAYLESEGSMTECIDAFTSNIHFTADTHFSMVITNSGFEMTIDKSDGSTVISSSKLSPTSPTSMSLAVALDYSMYLDETTLSGKLSSTGYSLNIDIMKHFDKPEGDMTLNLSTSNMSGAFNLTAGEKMMFSLNLTAPWSVDYDLYGIQLSADLRYLSLHMTHGDLSIKDFDPVETGFISIIDALSNNDFTMTTKASITIDNIDVYKSSRQEIFAIYKDVELEVRSLTLYMEREKEFLISMDHTRLSAVREDGSIFEKELKHLDIDKDLSGVEPYDEKIEDFVFALTVIFTVVSAAMIIILIYLRVKRPELFKFVETEIE